MDTTMFDRRRAERFAELLEQADGSGHRRRIPAPEDEELSPLVTLAGRVATARVPAQADAEFRLGLRAMLMATIEREGIGATAIEPPCPVAPPRTTMPIRQPVNNRRSRARVAVLTGITAGALALSGVSAASGDAMPGDALYQVKRSAEQAQLALAGSELGRGQLYLDFARVRLNELSRTPSPLVDQVLLEMDAETRQGMYLLAKAAVDHHDPTAIGIVSSFADQQRNRLRGILGSAWSDHGARINRSLDLLDRIEQRISALKSGLTCGASVVATDELGPVLDKCVAAPDSLHTSIPGSVPGSAGQDGAGRGKATPGTGPSGNASSAQPQKGAPKGSNLPTPGSDADSGTTSGAPGQDGPGQQASPPVPPTHNEGLLEKLGRIFDQLLSA